jgi:hypothetical protein
VENFNQLTNAETERLAVLAEELGEVLQIVGKTLRHGYESRNPLEADSLTNRRLLEKELGDVMHMVQRMYQSNDIVETTVIERSKYKASTIAKWLHHQE